MMQAVILAGGLGTRLRPLTEKIPKPMVLVRGKPFLQHQLGLLASFGVTDILLLVRYLGWKIEEYFGDGSGFGLRIQYAHEETRLGTGGALKNAEEKLQPEFLLLNGDTYLAIDYGQLVECFHKRCPWGLVVAYENQNGTIPNNLGLGLQGQVVAYNKCNPSGLTHVDAGVAVFSKRIVQLIPGGRTFSLEEELYPELIESCELWGYRTSQPFYDIGSIAGLDALEDVLA